MALEIKYTANTGMCTISTANSNLDGSGTLGTVITAGAKGTLIKTIIIKAQTDTRQGMVRFFVNNGSVSTLILEVNIPIIAKSSRDCSYYNILPLNYSLQEGAELLVSTQIDDTFNIIAEGLDWTYPDSFIQNSAEYTANTGGAIVSTANSNLDGTGTLQSIIEANSEMRGCEISSILIKALAKTSPGMVRLFLLGPNSPFDFNALFHEVIIPSVIPSASEQSFSFQVMIQGSFALAPGFLIKASTENNDPFAVTIQGQDWNYPLS